MRFPARQIHSMLGMLLGSVVVPCSVYQEPVPRFIFLVWSAVFMSRTIDDRASIVKYSGHFLRWRAGGREGEQ